MTVLVTGNVITSWSRITGSSQTTVFTANKRTTVVQMTFTHHVAASTPTLTVLRNDGTNDHYFRNAEAISAAKAVVTFDEVFTLNPNDTIKVTSSAAGGEFHSRITYLAPDTSAQ